MCCLIKIYHIFRTIIEAGPLQLEQLRGKTLDLKLHASNDSQDRLRCDFILLGFFCSLWFIIVVKTVKQLLKDRVLGGKIHLQLIMSMSELFICI